MALHSILAWNVRGLGAPEKRARVKGIIKRQRASIVGLTETKWNECSQLLVSSVGGSRRSKWVSKDAIESRGGIVIFWEPANFELIDVWEGSFSLTVRLQCVENNQSFALMVVYGPQVKEEKLAFIREMNLVCQRYAQPLCLIGDFNLVRSQEDFRGGPRNIEVMLDFNSFIAANSLMDLPLKGALFTWSSGGISASLSRIDRALVNPSFEEEFEPGPLIALNRVESDHNPIVLQWGALERRRRPWKFENMWLEEPSFFEQLVGWWNVPVNGSGLLFRCSQRLRTTKQLIKGWNAESFGKIDRKVAELLSKVNWIDRMEEQGPIADDLFIERCRLKCELDRVLLMEEISWRQKSRELWLGIGDKNTGFFHRWARNNGRKNWVRNLKVDGRVIEDKEQLQQVFINHFRDRFAEKVRGRPFPAEFKMGLISQEENLRLSAPFIEAEVWNAICSCNGDKAPGPDGFTLAFFKKSWNIIKNDILKALDEFFLSGILPHSVAHSFVCLIPKKEAVEEVKDFRPISLIGSLNKIISKTIWARLQSFAKRAVSKFQFAGRKKKVIHEASLIANEAIDSRKRSGKPGIILKLDIEKAFDSVSWECLRRILRNMGMSTKLEKWIMGLVTCSKLSVLVNGESSGFFNMERGLKQGDPLSPLLFSFVMDILSFIIETMQEAGFIEGFHMDEDAMRGQVSHLLYADDAIVFCNATEEEAFNLLAALLCFQSITGLKINLDKSKIFPVGEVENIGRLAEILGCDWSFLHTVYLGLPLGAHPTSTTIWESILYKTQKKLEGWQGKYLSLGGRVILCNAVLASQPLYQCSLFRTPASIITKLERIQKDFIWSGTSQEKKIHLMAWETCKLPRKFGGLGITDLKFRNTALLAKWLWRFGHERGEWWRELISIKYPHKASEWISGDHKGSMGCSPWSQILKVSKKFWNFAWVEPGGGAWVSFWYDVWIKGQPTLAESFPRVVAAAASPICHVTDILLNGEGSFSWNLILKHGLRGGAESERANLLNLLHNLPSSLFSAGPSRLCWEPSPSSGFRVRSMYESLIGGQNNSGTVFPVDAVWMQGVPFKVCVFVWLAYHNKILTQDNLKKRGWAIPNRCVLCCKEEESVDHLFLTCSFTLSVWQIMRRYIKLPTDVDSSLPAVIRTWSRKKPACPQEWCTRIFLHALCWRLWRERNSRVFRDEGQPVIVACFRIGRDISDWLCANKKVDRVVADDWLRILKMQLLPRTGAVVQQLQRGVF